MKKFVLFNHSQGEGLQEYDRKAVALDTQSRYTPFPSLFLIHEMRVRGFHPFTPIQPPIGSNPPFQEWISRLGIYDNSKGAFLREKPTGSGRGGSGGGKIDIPFGTTTGQSPQEAPEGQILLDLNRNTFMEILAATRAMPSWKACVAEGLSWDGTADENIEKYVANVGIDVDVN